MVRKIEILNRPAPKGYNPVKASLGGIEFRHRIAFVPNLKRNPTRQKAAGRRDLARMVGET